MIQEVCSLGYQIECLVLDLNLIQINAAAGADKRKFYEMGRMHT